MQASSTSRSAHAEYSRSVCRACLAKGMRRIYRVTEDSCGSADEVAHLVALRFKVALEGGLDGDFSREALNDLDAGGLECGDLLGVVGEKADFIHAELLEDSSRELEVAAVGLEAEFEVGLD